MEALGRLIKEYSECLSSIRQNMTKIIKRYLAISILPIRRLFLPILIVEIILYVIAIVLLFIFVHPQLGSSSSEFRIEIIIILPFLFLFCDWKLFQEWFDKRRCLRRYAAILTQLMYFLAAFCNNRFQLHSRLPLNLA